jgi:imidazolonepropionase-like amidohydrolase
MAARWVIDGSGIAPTENGAVAVLGELITWVGPTRSLPHDYSAFPFIDFGEATITPGLIDCHAHFSMFADGRPYEEMAEESDFMMASASARNLRRHLSAGVTTARDNGARTGIMLTIREAVRRGYVEGPRLLVSDAPVTTRRGHFFWCGGEADGPEEVARQVSKLAARGVDHIKVMASGGDTKGTDPGEASYSEEELRSAVDTAHKLGKPIAAHCRAAVSVKRAIAAGIDCIEHGEFLEPGRKAGFFERAVVQELVASGAFLSPVLQASGWDAIQSLRHKKRSVGLTDAESRLLTKLEDETSMRLEQVRAMRETGMAGRVVAGTDAGCYDVSFGHMDYCAELSVAAGMTPLEAIQSMTGAAAEACHVSDRVGTLCPGKLADLAVFSGNAATDVGGLSDVKAVYQGGRLVAGSADTNSR